MPSKFKWSHSARPLKNNQGQRIEKMVLTHVWLSGIKAFPDTNSYFLDRIFYLNRDKVTIFTGSKHVLSYIEKVILTFLKQCIFLDIYTDNMLLLW
jgi:hypothetical protein